VIQAGSHFAKGSVGLAKDRNRTLEDVGYFSETARISLQSSTDLLFRQEAFVTLMLNLYETKLMSIQLLRAEISM
jgi:hypothetical protein